MKLSTLKIERFGARSNLQLADFSDQLNVVYGPNGSGKTTIINFIHWMLYGNSDGTMDRYLSTPDTTSQPYPMDQFHKKSVTGNTYATFPTGSDYRASWAGGELIVRHQHGHSQRIVRRADGSAAGQVAVTDLAGVNATTVTHPRLTGVDLSEYRTVFSFGFDQSPSLERVVSTAKSHGFDLTIDERRVSQIQHLTEQLNRQRAELGRYSHVDVRTLTARRDAIHREIADLEARKRDRLVEVERERSEILAQIEQRRSQLVGIQSWLHQVESTIQTRRNQLDAAARAHQQDREAYNESRHRKIEETDRQIQQWHQVLNSIRSRYEELRTKHLSTSHPKTDLAPQSFVDDDSDLRCLMDNLGYRVEDLEQDLTHLYQFDDRRGFEAKHEYLRSIMGTALQAMRADVARLSQQLRSYKSSAMHHEYESEMRHLRRCETELTELIESLSQRRDSLRSNADEPNTTWDSSPTSLPFHLTTPLDRPQANGSYREPLIRPWYESSTDASRADHEIWTYEDWKERDRFYHAANQSIVAPTDADHVHAPMYGPIPANATTDRTLNWYGIWHSRVDPVLEARLYHLQARRDQIAPRVSDLESQIRHQESRLEHLRHAFGDEDRRIEQLRVELQQIDEQCRLAQEYDRLQQAVRLTEEDLARLHAKRGSSEVLRTASALLHRMTCGKYRGIHISQTHQILLDDSTGRSVDYTQAGRGSRDQAYLAICLALVEEYQRRGVEQTLILNDIFINVDEDRGIATADVLTEFAGRGHQVILFTRHERIAHLFDSSTNKIFRLGARTPAVTPKPFVPPLPERMPEPVAPPSAPRTRVVDEAHTDWVSHWELPKKSTMTHPEPTIAPSVGAIVPDSDMDESDLGLGSPLDTVPTIDVNLARRFRDIGVVTIGQFLELDAEDASQRLSQHRISSEEISRWQSEIALQVYLCISGTHAQILVECGIADPEDLAIADLEHLLSRISSFLSSEEIRQRYQPYSRIDRETLARWIDMARRSNYRRRQRQNHSRKSSEQGGADYSRKPERPKRTTPTERSRRTATRVPNYNRTAKVPTPDVKPESKTPLKFYLNPVDPIVDAPSIGPKTAERFHAVGIDTVAEFLSADPVETADQLGYRRITAEIIAEWQTQARLASQIPNLRGHDAQILAACEVTTAQDLSRADSSSLFNRVKRFVSTTEGKRIIRNGKKPDQNEVADWIRWSQDSRAVQVA